jgi:hypothetical protein
MVLEFWGVRIVAVSPSRSSCTTLYKVVLSVALWDVPSQLHHTPTHRSSPNRINALDDDNSMMDCFQKQNTTSSFESY